MNKSVEDVISERQFQVEYKGFDPEHDDNHPPGVLAKSAVAYARHAVRVLEIGSQGGDWDVPRDWPWDARFWRPTMPRRDLVKAAALLIAEIDRIDRQMEN